MKKCIMKKIALVHVLLIVTFFSFDAKANCADNNNCIITNTWITFVNRGAYKVGNTDRNFFYASGGTASTNVYNTIGKQVGVITACIKPEKGSLKVSPSISCPISCQYIGLESDFPDIGYRVSYQLTDPKAEGGYVDEAEVEQYIKVVPGFRAGDDGKIECDKS